MASLPVFCAFGNVLVDICIEVDDEFLETHNLKRNRSSEVETNELFHQVLNMYKPISLTTGGSALNSVRIAQWILNQVGKKCAFFGSIGKDEFGEIVEKEIKHSGAIPYLMEHDSLTTGKCAALITGEDRTLVAYLGASNNFQESFLTRSDIAEIIENTKLVYVESFFLIHNFETICHLASQCKKHGKPFLLNLSGAYVCKDYYHLILDTMQYVDILFGNEDEAKAFAYMTGLKMRRKEDCSNIDIAMEFSRMLTEGCTKFRSVVITQGSGPIIVIDEGKCNTYNVEPVAHAHIKDTIGGGDAFVGGFLSMFVQGQPLDVCVKCGIYCGREIVQRTGCTVPEFEPKFKIPTVEK